MIPVGANKPVPIDVRVIAATNLPAEQLHDERRFRQDLLFRLNTVEIELPPLRERREDIGLARPALHRLSIRANMASPTATCPTTWSPRSKRTTGRAMSARFAMRAERAVILGDGEAFGVEDFSLARADRAGRAGAAAHIRAQATTSTSTAPNGRWSRRRCASTATISRRRRPSLACRAPRFTGAWKNMAFKGRFAAGLARLAAADPGCELRLGLVAPDARARRSAGGYGAGLGRRRRRPVARTSGGPTCSSPASSKSIRFGDLSQNFAPRRRRQRLCRGRRRAQPGDPRSCATSGRQLSDANRFFEAVLDDAPTALLIIDEEGRVELGNKAARRLFMKHRGVRIDDFGTYGSALGPKPRRHVPSAGRGWCRCISIRCRRRQWSAPPSFTGSAGWSGWSRCSRSSRS